jgi:carbonic anhydrase
VTGPAAATRRTDPPSLSDEYRRLLAENERYAEQIDRSRLTAAPLAGVAILTCMDTRIVIEDIFGLRTGDANVIRNAGAVASDDAIRSLLLSRHLLGTSEIVVVGHTGCGLDGLDEGRLRDRLEAETGQPSSTRFGTFHDVETHVRRQVERIQAHPWIGAVPVHGLVFEVETGRVREVL